MSPVHAFEIGVALGAGVVAAALYFRHRLAVKAEWLIERIK